MFGGQTGWKAPIDEWPSFVPVCTDDHRHAVERARLEQESWLIGNLHAVDDRPPLHATCLDDLIWSGREGAQHDIARLAPQARDCECGILAPDRGSEITSLRLRFVGRSPPVRGNAAFHDRAMEQPLAAGRHEMQADALAPCGRARNRDVVRVSAERGDMVAHPFERRTLIEQAIVARRGVRGILGAERGMGQKTEGAESIVRRHDDRAGLFGHAPAVVRGKVRGRLGETAGVKPDDDG